jgi:DNA invertase Pin-like site-specific DNA recombinase
MARSKPQLVGLWPPFGNGSWSRTASPARSPWNSVPIGGQLFAQLQRGDIVVAAQLDRLFRSALDALKVVESLKGKGVKLHLLDLGATSRAMAWPSCS